MSLANQLAKQAAQSLSGRPKWSPALEKAVSRYFWKWRHPEGQSFRLPVSRNIPAAFRGKGKNQDPYSTDTDDSEDGPPVMEMR